MTPSQYESGCFHCKTGCAFTGDRCYCNCHDKQYESDECPMKGRMCQCSVGERCIHIRDFSPAPAKSVSYSENPNNCYESDESVVRARKDFYPIYEQIMSGLGGGELGKWDSKCNAIVDYWLAQRKKDREAIVEMVEEELAIQKSVQENARRLVYVGRMAVSQAIRDKYERKGKIAALDDLANNLKSL